MSRRLRGLAWATLGLDYAENVACGVLLATFPNESAAVASLAGVLTAVKFAGYAACVVAVLFAMGRAGIAEIQGSLSRT